ncbi:MAG: DUF751 family protein [Synechococcus sp. SB0668_bin_15]|nr:DUF751 family protein [Synechococcus sp. SB0668_bin_15]MXZ82139.1 DUF751 family protein [Synechococcus sp. SB0666_bin_14]MYA90423.1 DUF751 family protein [Synechococcus sp. SB0663_bin_10]MYC50117.1 DUF751 family protein [Synechococcus sp. SB0662_bin_14]MYG47664.1 DUF751 family protein [Synechococcus sp. SB0675_bin_6]MYJ60249.1 DUF751 family protein [Synechococcus sp. SB0672_bin_6]MYK92019.1 DUF751 family protein [Synechococcus sp. SB0669_bin_8]
MGNLLATLTKYPRFLLGFVLGIFISAGRPFLAWGRRSPVAAVALIGAVISGAVCLMQILDAMLVVSGEA